MIIKIINEVNKLKEILRELDGRRSCEIWCMLGAKNERSEWYLYQIKNKREMGHGGFGRRTPLK
ncbi:hypothetical protein RYX45_23540, partial [Alkalihalophilus pseudofirmus]